MGDMRMMVRAQGVEVRDGKAITYDGKDAESVRKCSPE
jgi:hypothetical protein